MNGKEKVNERLRRLQQKIRDKKKLSPTQLFLLLEQADKVIQQQKSYIGQLESRLGMRPLKEPADLILPPKIIAP